MIYAIGDLHLSFTNPKPMNIFGKNWTNHEFKIKKDWEKKVKADDTVLLPGDFSWAISIEETLEDFKFLECLPGKKIMSKGNHDYWWNSLKKLQEYTNNNNFKSVKFLHNNSFEVEGYIIARN